MIQGGSMVLKGHHALHMQTSERSWKTVHKDGMAYGVCICRLKNFIWTFYIVDWYYCYILNFLHCNILNILLNFINIIIFNNDSIYIQIDPVQCIHHVMVNHRPSIYAFRNLGLQILIEARIWIKNNER